jgi:helix-turn-helix protein
MNYEIASAITNRAAFSPREFAAACGRHPTWAYRLLYSGKINAIAELGRILIPAAELERVLNLAAPYDPKPKPKPESKPKAEQPEAGQSS